MDDANSYYKPQTYLNACSDADDSTSLPSFLWFPENNRRRKSRLGTHRNQIRRVFQEATSNDGDHSSSNKENIYDRVSCNTSPPNPAPAKTIIEELGPSISYDDMETSPISFTKSKVNRTSPLLSIPQVFDDGVSPLVTSFEKSRTMASSFPSYLAEDFREINSSDSVKNPHLPQSSSFSKWEKSFDTSVNSAITNHLQTAATKLNNFFSGESSNEVSSTPAVEDLSLASREHTNNCRPVTEYVHSDCKNSSDQHNLSFCCSDSENCTELLSNSVFQPVTKNNSLHYMNSYSAVHDLDSRNSIESSDSSSKPITENCSLDSTNSIEPTSDSQLSRYRCSDPSNPSRLPIDLSSMQDQENAVDFQNPNDTNSKSPIDLPSMLNQENYLDFQYPIVSSEPPIDLFSMHDQDNFVESQNPYKMNPELPINGSSIQGQKNTANIQSPVESSSNLASKEIPNNIEVDGVLSSTELKTISMSIGSVAEIPPTVKLKRAPVLISGDDKISGSSAKCDSNVEEKNIPAEKPPVRPLNTPVVAPPSGAPKPAVKFVEPAVVREFAVPRNSSKIPATITVKGKSYKVLNILGSGGSSVVFQVSDPETNELLALKKVDLPNEDDEITDGYLNEVQMLENLQNCDVIIRIFDHQLVYKNGKKTLHVVMEKGDTDLSSLIKSVNESKKLSIPMIIYYWTEMLAAVNEVHRQGIIHSDLKPANFVLVRGRLKLIDFGIASSIQGDSTSVFKDVFCGTLNYMSPEATRCVECPSGGAGYKITFKTDVWSLGCILYNLVYGRLPFHHIRNRFEKIHAIVSPAVNVEFPEKKDVPPILISLLKSCLEKDYKRRPTVQELLDRTMRIFQCGSDD